MRFSSIAEVIHYYAVHDGNRLFLVDEGGEYTYLQIWYATQNLAKRLENQGVSHGACVLAECTQNVEYLVACFACNLMGYIFVPLEKGASEETTQRIYEETDAVLFLSWNNDFLSVPKYCYSVQELLTEENSGYPFQEGSVTSEILYTTGTTGKSKGIEITNDNNIALAENIMYGTEMKEGNVELLPLPLSHSHALRCLYANVLRGATVVIADGVTKIQLLMKWIPQYGITAFDLSPIAAKVLLKLTKGKLGIFKDQIDYIQIGTAFLSEDIKTELRELFPNSRLYNFYGSTESGRTCVYNFNCAHNREKCIGRPTKNASFIVVDDNGKPMESSENQLGLLATSGPMNMKGYWRQPVETDKVMQNGYVYSRDLGYIDSEGFVYVVGRQDDIINFKGIKIAPDEIEQIALRSGMIKDCACVSYKNSMMEESPKLYVSLETIQKKSFSKEQFMSYLRNNIDANKVPTEVEVIEEIPRTGNGKLNRASLKQKEML